MTFKSKYIIIDTLIAMLPVVFSDLATHRDIANGVGSNVIGAGFCYINDEGKYVCYGESVSLNVKSRGDEDSKILNKFLGTNNEY